MGDDDALRNRAAENDTAAMVRLGVIAWRRHDEQEARTWFERAAGLGDATAMNNLGVLSTRANDDQAARLWYERALAQDDNAARENLKALDRTTSNATSADTARGFSRLSRSSLFPYVIVILGTAAFGRLVHRSLIPTHVNALALAVFIVSIAWYAIVNARTPAPEPLEHVNGARETTRSGMSGTEVAEHTLKTAGVDLPVVAVSEDALIVDDRAALYLNPRFAEQCSVAATYACFASAYVLTPDGARFASRKPILTIKLAWFTWFAITGIGVIYTSPIIVAAGIAIGIAALAILISERFGTRTIDPALLVGRGVLTTDDGAIITQCRNRNLTAARPWLLAAMGGASASQIVSGVLLVP